MSSRAPRIERRRYEAERNLAPDLEEAWAEKLIIELRLSGVDGARIGAALAEANSHCAESGQTASEAFGDPVEYARSLNLPKEEKPARGLAGVILPVAVQIAGMNAFLAGLAAWKSDAAVHFTAGNAVVVVLLLGAFALLALRAEPFLRLILAHPFLAGIGFMTFIVLNVLALVLLQEYRIAELEAAPTVAGGTTLLLLGILWQIRISRAGQPGAEDPLISPIDTTPQQSSGRLVSFMMSWLVPLYTVVLAAITLL